VGARLVPLLLSNVGTFVAVIGERDPPVVDVVGDSDPANDGLALSSSVFNGVGTFVAVVGESDVVGDSDPANDGLALSSSVSTGVGLRVGVVVGRLVG